jgi:hypothetical protein
MTKDEVLARATNLDQEQPGERWNTWWRKCPTHTRDELQATSDEPRHIFCARCLCVWEPPVGQLFPDQGAASPGRLLNEPLR